jgi:hypothetical protein
MSMADLRDARADAKALAEALRDIQHYIDANLYDATPLDLAWVRDQAELAADAHEEATT